MSVWIWTYGVIMREGDKMICKPGEEFLRVFSAGWGDAGLVGVLTSIFGYSPVALFLDLSAITGTDLSKICVSAHLRRLLGVDQAPGQTRRSVYRAVTVELATITAQKRCGRC
jgi:hypothetical protein